jgi:hypothetical protein
MMNIRTLGFRTEMIFHRFDGLILDRGHYLVVKTPSNPGFYFGNFLLFFEAPYPGALEKWKGLFQKEFSDCPEVKHFTFLWDSPQGAGDVGELREAGFKTDFSVVLTAKAVHEPRKHNPSVIIRPISTNAEWSAVAENQILSKSANFEEREYRVFKKRQMARYRTMAEKGLGQWFGAL